MLLACSWHYGLRIAIFFGQLLATSYGNPDVVHGNWGSWQLGKCSVTCGPGWRQRIRYCENPPPKNGGSPCKGPSIYNDACRMPPCEFSQNSNRREWSEWSPCSGECGIGTRRRTRICQTVNCNEIDTQIESCTNDAAIPPCPIDGGWTDWFIFLPCPQSTEKVCSSPRKYQKVEMRFCSNPYPAYGGKECEGPEYNYTSCSLLMDCGAAGQWSTWQSTGPCSVTCGVGFERKNRYCLSNRSPAMCYGPSSKIEPCTMPPCNARIDGGWSPWRETKSCKYYQAGDSCPENDFKILERQCNNPSRRNGGSDCEGESFKTEKCPQVLNCELKLTSTPPMTTTGVVGSWGEWINVGACSSSCGDGIQLQRRKCMSDAMSDCPGQSEHVIPCQVAPCSNEATTQMTNMTIFSITEENILTVTLAGDGSGGYYEVDEQTTENNTEEPGYTPWTAWSKCDKNCHQTRTRLCKAPTEPEGSGSCLGEERETRLCSRRTKNGCMPPGSDARSSSGESILQRQQSSSTLVALSSILALASFLPSLLSLRSRISAFYLPK